MAVTVRRLSSSLKVFEEDVIVFSRSGRSVDVPTTESEDRAMSRLFFGSGPATVAPSNVFLKVATTLSIFDASASSGSAASIPQRSTGSSVFMTSRYRNVHDMYRMPESASISYLSSSTACTRYVRRMYTSIAVRAMNESSSWKRVGRRSTYKESFRDLATSSGIPSLRMKVLSWSSLDSEPGSCISISSWEALAGTSPYVSPGRLASFWRRSRISSVSTKGPLNRSANVSI
mmetsp:Transcript_11074/g.29183  ORF Transcript_11074/g.29183 Transcript_11074/m.29183 type:complete len:232 (+) Transcript_11074:2929-3624(+)